MRVGMFAPQITVDAGGALDWSGRALVECDATRKRACRNQAIEMAFRGLEPLDIGDKFDPKRLERLAQPRARREVMS